MTEYLSDFVQESEEHITELNNALLALERTPDDDEAMENIFRIAHTLKGNCGAMGLGPASDLAHAIEDLLDAVRAGRLEVSPELMDVVFDAVDDLETMIDEVGERGEVETDPSPTIRALREPLSEPTVPSIERPSPDEIEDVLSRFEPPTDDDHDAYLARLAITPHPEINNGELVVKALIDAFELLGTVPPRDVIETDAYGGSFDAVFGSAVGEAAIESGLEPVEEVADFEIVEVTDRLDERGSDGASVDAGGELSATEAQELEVDELLDEFDEFDDLDERVEELDDDDLDAFEEMGDAGSFDDLFDDADLESPSGEPATESPETGADADAATETGTTAGSPPNDVEDASAVFAELKDEVEMVGFDELQDELEELEFDEFDTDEEVDIDDLLEDDDEAFFEDDGTAAEGEAADEDAAAADESSADAVDAGVVDPAVDADEVASPESTDESGPAQSANVDEAVDATADPESDAADREDDGTDEPPADVRDTDDAAAVAAEETDEDLAESGDEDLAESGDEDPTVPDVDDDVIVAPEPDEDALDDGPSVDAESEDDEPVDDDRDDEDALETAEDGTADDDLEAADDFAADDGAEDELADEMAGFDDGDDLDDGFGETDSSEAIGAGDADDGTTVEFDADAADEGFDADSLAFDEEDGGFADEVEDSGFDEAAGADAFDPIDGDDSFDDVSADSLDVESVGPGDSFEETFGDPFVDDSSDAGFGSDAGGSADDADDGSGGDSDDEPIRVVDEPELPIPEITVPEPTDRSRDADEETDAIQSVRVDVEQIDSLLTLVEGLVTSRVRLRHAIEEGEDLSAIAAELDDLEDLTTELQETVMDVRLVPLETVTSRLPRVVRDIAREQEKEVAFEMSGEGIELDRSILDRIGDPLIHLVRNAVDHGIEPPDQRATADKPREGTIAVSAERSRDRVTITVADDGSGLDPDRLRSSAVDADVLTDEEAADLDDDEAADLVFHPGLSTNEEVTDVSGRGVGMDVVNRTIEDLGGTVSVDSDPGEGTTVTMTLPVTVAIDDVLFVESGGEEFGIPTKAVQDIEAAEAVETADGELVRPDEDDTTPLVRLEDALEAPAVDGGDDGMVVRIREEVRSVALHCDRVHGQQEVVVTPFEGFMSGVPGLSGATVRGRGKVVNILDVTTL